MGNLRDRWRIFYAKTFRTNLDFSTREDITSLPDGLRVRGNLNLRDCTGLKALPDGLSVCGDLELDCCTGLTALPDGLSVAGNMYLEGCTGITSLPESLLTWPPRNDGNPHEIYLGGSGLVLNNDTEWLGSADAPNLEFHVEIDNDPFFHAIDNSNLT